MLQKMSGTGGLMHGRKTMKLSYHEAALTLERIADDSGLYGNPELSEDAYTAMYMGMDALEKQMEVNKLLKTAKENNIIGEQKRLIAGNIKKHRIRLLMSQQELADRCGLHRTYISDLERCKGNPTLDVLIVIACNLNTNLNELMGI